MNETNQRDLADTVGTDVARLVLLEQIVAKVEGFDAAAADEDLDQWWGAVEVDRLSSGLTLATIAKLSDPSGGDDPAGSWLRKSDASGDAPTRLTPEGRTALRRITAAKEVA